MTSSAVAGSRPARTGTTRRYMIRSAVAAGILVTSLVAIPTQAHALDAGSFPAAAAAAATAATAVTPSSAVTTSGTSPEITASVFREAVIDVVLRTAFTKLGAPYSYGSAGPGAFDCSGFTRWAWQQMGVTLDHNSGAQWAQVEHIDVADLQPGDLVFNWGNGAGSPDHVGLYVGNGYMIHAPNGGSHVKFDPITWWTGASIGAGRVL